MKRASHVPEIDAGDAERASLDELAELVRSAGAQGANYADCLNAGATSL
jgi:hypothetical protein